MPALLLFMGEREISRKEIRDGAFRPFHETSPSQITVSNYSENSMVITASVSPSVLRSSRVSLDLSSRAPGNYRFAEYEFPDGARTHLRFESLLHSQTK